MAKTEEGIKEQIMRLEREGEVIIARLRAQKDAVFRDPGFARVREIHEQIKDLHQELALAAEERHSAWLMHCALYEYGEL